MLCSFFRVQAFPFALPQVSDLVVYDTLLHTELLDAFLVTLPVFARLLSSFKNIAKEFRVLQDGLGGALDGLCVLLD